MVVSWPILAPTPSSQRRAKELDPLPNFLMPDRADEPKLARHPVVLPALTRQVKREGAWGGGVGTLNHPKKVRGSYEHPLPHGAFFPPAGPFFPAGTRNMRFRYCVTQMMHANARLLQTDVVHIALCSRDGHVAHRGSRSIKTGTNRCLSYPLRA
jgi:hypothetical protein